MHTCALCVRFILHEITENHHFCLLNLNKQFANSCLFTAVSRSCVIMQNNTFAIFQLYLSDYSFIIYLSLPERVFNDTCTDCETASVV